MQELGNRDTKTHFLFWNVSVCLLSLYGVLLFLSLNFQYKTGIRWSGYLNLPAMLLLAAVIGTTPLRPRIHPTTLFAALASLAMGWVWGLFDVFYWDGILTAGRACLIMDGKWDELTRFSLTYPIVAALFSLLGNANWIGHGYIMAMGAGMLWLLWHARRARAMRIGAVVLAFATPHVFVLSKWFYLDIPVIAGLVATVVGFHWASRRGGAWRYALATAALLATVLLKEAGFLAVVPLAVLPLTMPRGRRVKTAFIVAACIAIAAAGFALLLSLYRQPGTNNTGQVEWLLFAHPEASAMQTFNWFHWAIREHLRGAIWWEFFAFAGLGLIRPRRPGGHWILVAILVLVVVALRAVSDFQPNFEWHYYPLREPAGDSITNIVCVLIGLLVLGGLAAKQLAPRPPRRLDWLCWSMAAAVLFIFSAAGKAFIQPHGLWITIDWRYFGAATPFVAILAARGAAHLFHRRYPLWLRIAAALALAYSFQTALLRSTATAAYFSGKARLTESAYLAAVETGAPVVYTHWPFVMDFVRPFDYGSMRWHSEGITLRPLDELLSGTPPPSGAHVLHVYTRSQRSFSSREISRPVWTATAEIRFLEPIRSDYDTAEIESAYLGAVEEP